MDTGMLVLTGSLAVIAAISAWIADRARRDVKSTTRQAGALQMAQRIAGQLVAGKNDVRDNVALGYVKARGGREYPEVYKAWFGTDGSTNAALREVRARINELLADLGDDH